MTSKFLGVPLKIAGWRPKAGGLLFSKKKCKKPIEKKRKLQEKLKKFCNSLKNFFFRNSNGKKIFSNCKL